MVRRIRTCHSCSKPYISTINEEGLCHVCYQRSSTAVRNDSSEFSSSCSNGQLQKTDITIDSQSEENEQISTRTSRSSDAATRISVGDSDCCFSNPKYSCIVCGCSLSHITSGTVGKLNHVKRCAKKHAVCLQDIKSFAAINSFEVKSDFDDSRQKHSFLPQTEQFPRITQRTESNIQSKDDKIVIEILSDEEIEESSTATNRIALHREESNHDIDNSNTNYNSLPCTDAIPSSTHYNVNRFKENLVSSTTIGITEVPKKSINNVLMAGAKKMAQARKSQVLKRSSSQGVNNRKRQWNQTFMGRCPNHKRIPGTSFICDGFHYAKKSLSSIYFLTHFHSDHYGGLNSKWDIGLIYCSLPTANLVHQQLGVEKQYIRPIPVMKPTVIFDSNSSNEKKISSDDDSKPITVTLIDANHCPGAVMFLFQSNSKHILHVGDFRWDREKMLNATPLVNFATLKLRLDELMLDTTYCDKKYANLPTQEEAINATIRVIEKEIKNQKSICRTFFKKENVESATSNPNILFLFGSYSIGKERIYLSVARHFGFKVYVDQRRLKMIQSFNWPSDQMRLFTTQKSESNLWVVPLGHINFQQMPKYLKQLGSKSKGLALPPTYDRVVGFRPTGWTFAPNRKDLISKRIQERCSIFNVPYSEHSSFSELVDCLKCLKPKKITPTVSVSKSEIQCRLLLDSI